MIRLGRLSPKQEWGLNLTRRIIHLNEESNWAPVQLRFSGNQADMAGTLRGLENIRQHEIELTRYALDKIRGIKDITIYGPPNAEDRGGVVAFTMGNVHPHDIGTALDQYGVAIRAGHHCAQPLHRRPQREPRRPPPERWAPWKGRRRAP